MDSTSLQGGLPYEEEFGECSSRSLGSWDCDWLPCLTSLRESTNGGSVWFVFLLCTVMVLSDEGFALRGFPNMVSRNCDYAKC